MHHPGYEMSLEFWHFLYAAYIFWVAGLMAFFTLATVRARDRIVAQLQSNWLGKLVIIWVGGALLVAGFAWPLLIVGPILIVQVGAPVSAGIISAGYMLFCFYLSGKLMMERWPGIGNL